VIGRVAEKDAGDRTRGELVSGGGYLIRITQAAKHAQMVVIGWCAEKTFEWSAGRGRMAWSTVNQMCGRGERLGPVGIWHAGMDEEAADTIIQSSDDSFGFAILC
jgi:hypothetical protein